MKWLQSIANLVAGTSAAVGKNLIVDTDLFSDVDDAGALLLAATSPEANLMAVNVNYPSAYSAIAASAILAYYGKTDVPIGIRRPLSDITFTDNWYHHLGEYASKIAFQYSGGSLPWGQAEKAWDPVKLYRKVLAEAEDGSVTIASIGFLDNLSGLLNSTADSYSSLTGRQLVRSKVSELVIMGGGYPSGHSWNFWGSDPSFTAHVINTWEGKMTFIGDDVGKDVLTGRPLIQQGPANDPVRKGYIYYNYHEPISSWDPLTVLYAINNLDGLFVVGNEGGYNHIYPNGTNQWVSDSEAHGQFFLRLAVSNETAAAVVDKYLLQGALSAKAKSNEVDEL
ncbi:hypothetical protein S7711_11124 [Stachybotrys chartarum IBT 7711]|uniref:Inosine/uridine-preferring nucleoside hydrolase domain-containing protein n=1 Tax=Stachybotrys chartarum (strain CBS 109288 / IBT 7711) TaxID=1280523 RepID=A0A084BAG4_STACB|nr:hypothetical protein S7711_11124 [Stachybotrys chartarum IBT 7711]